MIKTATTTYDPVYKNLFDLNDFDYNNDTGLQELTVDLNYSI